MIQKLAIQAELREDFGKNAARRLRRAGRIPAVVYGGGGRSIPVIVDPGKIFEILHTEFGHNAIFSLEVRGEAPARAMLREWQTDPVHGDLLHVDMVRVAEDTKLKVKVPIHVTGEAQGVKVQGGVFEFISREVEVECLPDDIPDHVTVDVTELTIGRNLRVGDLPLGPKVKAVTDLAAVVAHVVAMKAEEEKPAAEAVEAAPAEPEVIRKGKTEEEKAKEEPGETKKEGRKES